MVQAAIVVGFSGLALSRIHEIAADFQSGYNSRRSPGIELGQATHILLAAFSVYIAISLLVAVLAFHVGRRHNGARIALIAVEVVIGIFSVAGAASGSPPLLLLMLTALATVVLLTGAPARAAFGRVRTVPGHEAAVTLRGHRRLIRRRPPAGAPDQPAMPTRTGADGRTWRRPGE